MASPSEALTQAQQLLAAGRRRDARALLEPLAAQPGADRAILRQLAELEILDGDAQGAYARLSTLDAAGDEEVDFLLARAEEALGRVESARDRLLALRARLAKPSPPLEMQLAIVQQRLGDTEAALATMRAVVAMKPDFAAAHKNLAAILAGQGRMEETRDALRRAVAAVPNDASLWVRLAAIETHFGDSGAALASLAKAVQAMPAASAPWREIGYAYAEHWQYEEADRALALASALDPGEPEIESHRAFVKQELGDTAGALQVLKASAARVPGNLRVAVSERLMLPQVYEDLEDVARWRQRYTQGMGDLERNIELWLPRAAEVFMLNRNNFLLAYQGEDDTELQRRYSTFLARLIGRARPEWRAGRAIRFDGGRRLRVGFVGSLFRDCTAGRYFEGWITGLDPRRFERFVYHTAPVADAFTQRIAQTSEHFSTLRASTEETAAKLYADDLDVIVHPEVGMNSLTYELAAMRLAPVQFAGWGHPVTTGSDAIDHYLTCGPMEPADGQRHYVEHLVALPGLGVDYSLPAPQPAAARAQLGLPEGRRLYLCAQSLFKVHPEMDGLLADILVADPEGILVFFQASGKRVTENLAGRLQRAFAQRRISPKGQLKFLPRMDSGQFRRVLALADVVLDTVRWSGGNTSIDAFAAGVPVVTLPGRFMRGRQTAGMLEMMDLRELIASDPADYVRIAVGVARDRERNAALRRAIAERREVLFDRPEPVAAFSEALLTVGAGAR
ncbi:MAG: O-linked N-acetylglucosamine transferase, SPINDLY family protein [Usitatibacter sp.]